MTTMNDIATRARKNASHCEVKKHALRQTQDGVVVAFVLHPNDVPATLQLAPLGTRYMLALVEIDEDETPKQRENTIVDAPVRRAPVAIEKRLIQQAGICCSDPMFQTFLYEHDMAIEKNEECATTAVRLICSVQTRKDIIPGTPAAALWRDLYGKFLAWKLAA